MIFNFNGEENITYIYNTNRQLICYLEGTSSVFSAHRVDIRNKLFASQFDRLDNIKIWNMENGRLINELFTDDLVLSIIFSKDGKYLYTCNDESKLRIWDLGERRIIQEKIILDTNLYFMEYTPNYKYLLIGGNKNIKMYDADNLNHIRDFPINESKVYTIYFSPDSNYFALSTWEFRVAIWDIETGIMVQELGALNQFVGIYFSSKNIIATKHFNDMVMIWKIGCSDYIFSHKERHYARFFNINWENKKVKIDKRFKKQIYKSLDKLPKEIIDHIINYVKIKECLTLNGKILFIDT